tara:strand:+ start:528 stop:1151 length:624 start_codon:yes stop_codon:yes gene_type:complete
MNIKNIFWGLLGLLVTSFFLTNYFFGGNDAAVKEAMVAVAKADSLLAQAETKLDSASVEYDRVVDSLSLVQDSISDVVVVAQSDARRASARLNEEAQTLQDSLAVIDSGLAQELDRIMESHEEVVTAMQTEIDALNHDRELLWRRIEVSDSMLAVQVEVNQALRHSVIALEGERDAWRAKASPSLPKRLLGHTTAVLTGAVLIATLR